VVEISKRLQTALAKGVFYSQKMRLIGYFRHRRRSAFLVCPAGHFGALCHFHKKILALIADTSCHSGFQGQQARNANKQIIKKKKNGCQSRC